MNCTLVFKVCSVAFLWCKCSHTVGLHYFVLRIHCQTSMWSHLSWATTSHKQPTPPIQNDNIFSVSLLEAHVRPLVKWLRDSVRIFLFFFHRLKHKNCMTCLYNMILEIQCHSHQLRKKKCFSCRLSLRKRQEMKLNNCNCKRQVSTVYIKCCLIEVIEKMFIILCFTAQSCI